MALYRQNMGAMPQAAQSAMSSATNAMAHQQKQETRTTTQKTSFWDDLYKGARAVQAGANAVNSIVDTVGDATQLYDDFKIKGAYDNIAKAFNDGGIEAIQNNPDLQDYHHSIALGQFVKDRANTEKGRLEMMEKANKIADMQYQDFRNQAILVRDAYQNGEMDKYMAGMQQLVSSAPIPYRLELDGKGNFKELFRSDEKGGWTETGRTITPEQAFDQMNGLLRGEQMILRGIDGKLQPVNETFNRIAAANYINTSIGNGNAMADFKKHTPLYDRNGNFAGVGVRLNPWDKDGKLGAYGLEQQIKIFDRNGKNLGTFSGDEVMQLGLSSFNPAKGMARSVGSGSGGGGGSAGRSGGSSGGGRAGGQTMAQGNYGVSPEMRKMFIDVCTKIDENGNKITDYTAVAGLIAARTKWGKNGEDIAGAYQKATARGMSSDQAIRIIHQQLSDYVGGQTQTPSNQPQAEQTQDTGPQMDPRMANALADPRIREAEAGINANMGALQARPMSGLQTPYEDQRREKILESIGKQAKANEVESDFNAAVDDLGNQQVGYGSLQYQGMVLPSSQNDIGARSPFSRGANVNERVRQRDLLFTKALTRK